MWLENKILKINLFSTYLIYLESRKNGGNMKIKPIYDRVLLRPIQKETTSGLILPESETKSQLMEVIALGNSNDFQVKIGDKVLINSFAGSTWIFEKQTFTLIKEIDILAIVKEDK